MKILQAEQLQLEAYHLADAAIPEPAPGQLRIKVAACGVGYVDALVAVGGYQVKPPVPNIPGVEIAGVIDAIGLNVENFAVGDRVSALAASGFAEYATAAKEKTFKIPDNLSFEQAACLQLNYLTALHGLQDRAQLKPGERVLIMGAAGGVGLAAIQVARAMGATVIAAASTETKRNFALQHGAHTAIDTVAEGWRDRLKAACDGKAVDIIFDPVCGPLFQAAFRSLAWQGRHLVVGFIGGPIPALPANLTLMKGAALLGVDVRQFMLFQPTRAAGHLAMLLDWAEQNTLNPVVGQVFDLADGQAAMRFALSGAALGKTVIRVA